MDVHPTKNGMYRYWSIATYTKIGLKIRSPEIHWWIILLVLSREFSGMIHWRTINNHPSNPQQSPATHPFPTFSTSKSYFLLIGLKIKSPEIHWWIIFFANYWSWSFCAISHVWTRVWTKHTKPLTRPWPWQIHCSRIFSMSKGHWLRLKGTMIVSRNGNVRGILYHIIYMYVYIYILFVSVFFSFNGWDLWQFLKFVWYYLFCRI